MIYIGIDPGLDGAVAWFCGDGDDTAPRFDDTPVLRVGKRREVDVHRAASLLRAHGPCVSVAIESVHAMPGGGERRMGATSAFSFGKGFGAWLGILAALRLTYTLVPPQRWKKALMDGMPKEKDASRQRAMQLFPEAAGDLKLKKHHGRADALLIAEYLRRTSGAAHGARKAEVS